MNGIENEENDRQPITFEPFAESFIPSKGKMPIFIKKEFEKEFLLDFNQSSYTKLTIRFKVPSVFGLVATREFENVDLIQVLGKQNNIIGYRIYKRSRQKRRRLANKQKRKNKILNKHLEFHKTYGDPIKNLIKQALKEQKKNEEIQND